MSGPIYSASIDLWDHRADARRHVCASSDGQPAFANVHIGYFGVSASKPETLRAIAAEFAAAADALQAQIDSESAPRADGPDRAAGGGRVDGLDRAAAGRSDLDSAVGAGSESLGVRR